MCQINNTKERYASRINVLYYMCPKTRKKYSNNFLLCVKREVKIAI
jgi:hypothetical protein